jgi:hypothetical protein
VVALAVEGIRVEVTAMGGQGLSLRIYPAAPLSERPPADSTRLNAIYALWWNRYSICCRQHSADAGIAGKANT